VALERERVLVLARDPVALGHVLARLAHGLEREHLLHPGIREAPAERRVPGRPVTVLGLRRHERRSRHGFDPAGDEEFPVPGTDRVRGADHGGETRRAEAVDRDAGDALRQPSEESAHAGDVAVVLPRLVGGAEVDVFDRGGIDARALDGFPDDERREVVGALPRERAAVAPDGRSDCREDDRFSHEASLVPR
jgi:hypothetical protein